VTRIVIVGRGARLIVTPDWRGDGDGR